MNRFLKHLLINPISLKTNQQEILKMDAKINWFTRDGDIR